MTAPENRQESPQRPWNWGGLRRTQPVSAAFGYDRGEPIDRYYIERFLDRFRSDIRGRTLEIGDDAYTVRFGDERVTRRDVLHVHSDNPKATFVGDLIDAPQVPDDCFDCLVLTQTLHLIYDLSGALDTIHRILKPGGTVLATFPGISQVSQDEWCRTWSWGLSAGAAQRRFERRFGTQNVQVVRFGNRLAAAAFLQGLAQHELSAEQLDRVDPDCELLLAVRAQKVIMTEADPPPPGICAAHPEGGRLP